MNTRIEMPVRTVLQALRRHGIPGFDIVEVEHIAYAPVSVVFDTVYRICALCQSLDCLPDVVLSRRRGALYPHFGKL